MRVVPSSLFAAPPITRTVSPHQALRASFPLRGKPCIEPCSEQLLRSVQDPSTDARDDKESIIFQRSFGARGLKIGLPKSIEELFGKRSGRRNGQGGKRSEPSAMAPWRDEVGMTKAGRLLSLNMNVEEEGFLPPSKILHFTFYILHSTFTMYPPFPFKHIKTLPQSLDFCAVLC